MAYEFKVVNAREARITYEYQDVGKLAKTMGMDPGRPTEIIISADPDSVSVRIIEPAFQEFGEKEMVAVMTPDVLQELVDWLKSKRIVS